MVSLGDLIFWGSKKYDSKKFEAVKNIGYNKPTGGLWVSPLSSCYSWEDWCKENNFREEHFQDPENCFIVKLKAKTKIYVVNTLQDLIKLVKKYPDKILTRWYRDYLPDVEKYYQPDFEKIAKDYDAIYLTEKGQWETRLTHPNLYGWDCECVLILNKEVIELPTIEVVKNNLKEFNIC